MNLVQYNLLLGLDLLRLVLNANPAHLAHHIATLALGETINITLPVL
jgi:hypothetical protein